tara:strand:+ start:275 stop:442 length:168 start_codon:yes stop_codon:yes gene_type:complete
VNLEDLDQDQVDLVVEEMVHRTHPLVVEMEVQLQQTLVVVVAELDLEVYLVRAFH